MVVFVHEPVDDEQAEMHIWLLAAFVVLAWSMRYPYTRLFNLAH